MREHLLAKAAAARQSAQSSPRASASALDEVGRRHHKERDYDLDLLGHSARPPSAPVKRTGRGHLSPGMLAVFGTILGLATVSTLIALAMQLEPTGAQAYRLDAAPPATKRSTPAPKAHPAPKSHKRQRKKLPGPWRITDSKGKQGYRIIEGKIEREPFLRAIQAAGLNKKQAYRVLTALKGLRDLDS